jgi:hypothetical protein
MTNMSKTRLFRLTLMAAALMVGLLAAPVVNAQMMSHTSSPFQGPKANTGTVSHSKKGNVQVLTLSDDFVPPQTPDPHWRVVDSKGNVYDLDKLMIKPDMPSKSAEQMMDEKMMGAQMKDRFKKSIELPAYIKDVKKVIIWCAWAETNLGEAEFSKAVK